MNIFKKAYCRIYQWVFKVMLPILPYRQPKILKNNQEVVNILKQKGITNVLLVTDKGINGLGLTKALENECSQNGINVFVYDGTVPNPTTKNVEEAVKMYKQNNCGALLAFGGGSPMDCAKGAGAKIAKPNKPLSKMKGVLKVRKRIPLLIAVPTTAGTGSETTLAAVITDYKTRHKYAINDFPLIPRYALLDASLTVGLPKHITSTTGMDALTHAVEAYIGNSTTKKTRKLAEDAVKLIFENLEKAYQNGQNLNARQNMLIASYKAGAAFTVSYVGYVHAIAHSLGGKYDVPHGLANAVILPYVLKVYGKKIYKKLYKLGLKANLFDQSTKVEDGAKMFIQKVEQLNQNLNIPTSIKELKQEDIKGLAKTAEKEANPLYPVPVLMDAKALESIYLQILNG